MAKTPKSPQKVAPKSASSTPYVSIIVPLLDEEGSLRELYTQILTATDPLSKPIEIIFVDDGSTDTSFTILEELHAHDHRVKVIRFRRNFGKSAALSVGFHEARASSW